MSKSFIEQFFILTAATLLSATAACSRTNQSTESTTFANNMEARLQAVIPSQDLDYVISYRPLSLLQDFDSVAASVRGLNSQRGSLSCFVTQEVAGLFVCLGNNKAAQHIPLNRAAIFAESRPPLGVQQSRVIVSQEVSESGYEQSNGHDLTEQSLKEFFVALRDKCPDGSCIIAGEMDFAQKVMPEFERIYPYGYSVVSVDVSSGDKLKQFLAHEISHGQFFQQPQYRAAVYGFWSSLSPELRLAAADIVSLSYDRANIDLVINEFHAALLDRSYANISQANLNQFAKSNPKQSTSLALLKQNSEYLRQALITYLTPAVPVILYENLR